jgi:hypothetical protein
MHRTASLTFAASVFWTSAIAVAQVQPGSTGGTVGKQDKAVSGGNTPQESRPSTSKREPHLSVAKISSCGRIAGTWQWGGYTVVVKQDGSAHNSYGNVDGTWTCKDRDYVFVFAGAFIEHVTLSTNGNNVTGTNPLGTPFTGSRR